MPAYGRFLSISASTAPTTAVAMISVENEHLLSLLWRLWNNCVERQATRGFSAAY
jgi:hypothetical protein